MTSGCRRPAMSGSCQSGPLTMVHCHCARIVTAPRRHSCRQWGVKHIPAFDCTIISSKQRAEATIVHSAGGVAAVEELEADRLGSIDV